MRLALLSPLLLVASCIQRRPSGSTIAADEATAPAPGSGSGSASASASALPGSLPRPPASASSTASAAPPAPTDDRYARPTCDAPAARRALAVAVAAARKAGLTAKALSGCEGATPPCDAPALDDGPGACRANVRTAEGAFEVELRPASVDGAPLRLEVWISASDEQVGRVTREGSTWAVSHDGALLIHGQPGHAIHEHGGAPAMIGHARFVAYNEGQAERRLSLRSGAFVSDPGTSTPLDKPQLSIQDKPAAPVAVPARSRLELLVSFTPRSAYQSWNNRFIVEAALESSGELLKPAAETHVSRIEPLRPRHRP